jgi:DNA-binding FadR family transcriptional regulator
VTDGWLVGQVLGSEDELIERFGVSRAALREAVRIVEHHGVARMRRGPGGGLVVTAPDGEAIRRAISLHLVYAGVTAGDILEARAAVELAATAAATEHIDEAGIARLREVVAEEEALGADAIRSGRTRDLHVAIAEVSGNHATALLVDVLSVLNEALLIGDGQGGVDLSLYPRDLERAYEDYHGAHVSIVDAIASGDGALAQHRMRRHLDAIRSVSESMPVRPLLAPSNVVPESGGRLRRLPRRPRARRRRERPRPRPRGSGQGCR